MKTLKEGVQLRARYLVPLFNANMHCEVSKIVDLDMRSCEKVTSCNLSGNEHDNIVKCLKTVATYQQHNFPHICRFNSFHRDEIALEF